MNNGATFMVSSIVGFLVCFLCLALVLPSRGDLRTTSYLKLSAAIQACEADLPRNQTCKLIAVVDECILGESTLPCTLASEGDVE